MTHEFDDHLGHRLGSRRLRRVDSVSLGDQLAGGEIDDRGLHPAAADVDAEGLAGGLLVGVVTSAKVAVEPSTERRDRIAGHLADQTASFRASDQVIPRSTFGSRGRPRTCSATMLRCTANVPPPSVSAGWNR